MGKASVQFTMSLDGYIAGPNDDVRRLLSWYRRGDTEFTAPGSEMSFKVSRLSAEYLQSEWSNIGAIVTGRRDFDVSNAYGGISPFGVPMFIVTHQAPQEWLKAGTPFTFVTQGPEHALELAHQAAGNKDVDVGGSTIARQLLQVGLLDEIRIDLVPILLGAGVRLFERLGVDPIELEKVTVIDTPTVTHFKFRVVK